MYRLACHMPFYNGMRFDGLVEALAKKRKLEELHPHAIIDVIRDTDKKTMLVVEASKIAPSPNYKKFTKGL